MIEVKIVLSDDVKRALDPKQYERALDATVQAAAESLRKFIAVEPGPSNSPVIWASAKSRRFYFAQRREKGLPLKYTRNSDPQSQRISNAWTSRRVGQAVYIVGSGRATYARWVQSAAQQSAQHKATGWKTDVQAVDELQKSGDIDKAARQALAHLTGTR